MITTMGYGNVVILRSGLLKRQLPTGTQRKREPARPQLHSDIVTETAVIIRQVFHLPLRQTEGFMKSLARIMKADIIIPDFSSISKLCIYFSQASPELKQWSQPLFSLLIPPGSRSMAKTNGIRKTTPPLNP